MTNFSTVVNFRCYVMDCLVCHSGNFGKSSSHNEKQTHSPKILPKCPPRVLPAIDISSNHFDCKPCKKCHQLRPGVGLNPRGFHFDCEPCRRCQKIRIGIGLNYRGAHFDCESCKKCQQVLPGVGLNAGGFHFDCETKRN